MKKVLIAAFVAFSSACLATEQPLELPTKNGVFTISSTSAGSIYSDYDFLWNGVKIGPSTTLLDVSATQVFNPKTNKSQVVIVAANGGNACASTAAVATLSQEPAQLSPSLLFCGGFEGITFNPETNILALTGLDRDGLTITYTIENEKIFENGSPLKNPTPFLNGF